MAPHFHFRGPIVNDDEIRFVASRRASPAVIEGQNLPPNLEEVMRGAEQWNVSYNTIEALMEYATSQIKTFPTFTRSVVLRIADYPDEDSCNVLCMLRAIELDRLWVTSQVPALSDSQYIGMSFNEHLNMWHAVVFGVGVGVNAECVWSPSALFKVSTMLPKTKTPPIQQIDLEHLNRTMGLSYWTALSSMESRGLVTRTLTGGEYQIGARVYAASTARN